MNLDLGGGDLLDFSVNQVLDLCWTLDFWLDNNQSNLLDSFQYPLFLQLFSNYIVKKHTLWLTHCCVSGDVCDLCFLATHPPASLMSETL